MDTAQLLEQDVMKRTVLTCSNVIRSQNNPAKPISLLENVEVVKFQDLV